MSDERDGSDAAADGSETGGHGQTAVVTRPVTGPQRPAGKRSRQRAAAGADAADTELVETGAAEESGKAKKAAKTTAAKKKAEGPSRNPLVFVYNFLKQVVAELRKVIWPNRKQMITYTSVVLSFLVFMVALISASDYGFAKLVMLVFGE